MQEFDKHDVNTSVHLDNLAAEQRRQTPRLGAPETEKPTPSTEDEDEEDDNGTNNDTAEKKKKQT